MEEITLNNNLAPGSGLNVISGAKPEEIRSYQCKYCELIMESIEVFRQHICNFYKINGVIYIDTYERDVRELETMLNEHPVHKLFETNKMRAAMLLRDYRTENITGKQRELSKKGGDSYKCSICDRSFVHSSGLLRHLARHDIEDFPHNRTTDTAIVCLICKYCSRVFSDPNDLFRHFMTHFINESVASVATGRMVTGPLINTHYEIANVKHLFGCEFCDFFFKERDFLRKHFYAEHSCNRYYSCTNCNITSKTQRDYQIHKLIECTTAEMFAGVAIYYVCIVCDEGFSSLNQLYEHRTDSKHFGMDYDTQNLSTTMSCEICDFVTTSSDNFIVHRLEHSKDQLKKNTNRVPMPSTKSRQHLCDVCGKTYTQSSHLLQHLRFHQGVRPFACKEVGCTRKFTIRPDLNDHIRKCHTRERPYHCMVCDKRFLTGSVFYQHRLIHRGERRYACEECEKRFYRADALKNHKRIHTGEKPYKCDFCVKNFRQRGDRDKHIRARHGQQNQLQNRNLQADTVQQSEEPSPTSEVDAAAVKFDQADMYSSSMPNINDCDSDEPTDIKLEFPNNMLSSLISDIDCNLQLFN